MDTPTLDAASMMNVYTSSMDVATVWRDSASKNRSTQKASSSFSGKKITRATSKESQITPRKLFSNSTTPLSSSCIRPVTSRTNRKENKPIALNSNSTFGDYSALTSKKNLGDASPLILTDSSNQVVKEHFMQQMRTRFGDRIVNYFLLSANNKAYQTNDLPLTLGTVRAAISNAEKIETHVKEYVSQYSELDQEVATILGYATFFEQEAVQSYDALKELGIPSEHLAEGQHHALKFLAAAGVTAALVTAGSATMTGALMLAIHLSPSTGAALGLIPWSMGYGISNTQSRLRPEDSGTTRTVSNALSAAFIAPSTTLFANLLTSGQGHSLVLGAAGVLPLAGAFFLDFTRPARTLTAALPDPRTPLTEAGLAAVKLSQSTALLNHTIGIQKTVVDTYKEAAQLASTKNTTLPSPKAVEQSTQQLASLKQLKPESPYTYRSGRFRPALM